MRFMMFMIPGVYQNRKDGSGPVAGPEFTPPADGVEQMMRYNEELANSGALIALDGLTPPARGARVSFAGGKPNVTAGPFTESTEIVGGYWIIRAESLEEAVNWAAKCPAGEGDIIEVRPIFEMEEFPDDVKKAAKNVAVESATSGS